MPDQGWNALLALLPTAAVLIVLVALGRSRLDMTIPLFAAIVLFSAVLGVAQLGEGQVPLLRVYRVFTAGQPSGVFANRNHQALLLALGLPVLAVWAGRARTSSARHIPSSGRMAIALGGGIVIVMASLATGSRAGVALLLPAAASAAFFLRTSMPARSKWRRVTWAAAATAIVVAIGAMVLADRSESIARLFTSDTVSDKRAGNLAALLEMGRTFFPVGSGFGSFDPVFRRFEPYRTLTFTYFNEAHDDLLQVWIEGGLGGVLLMLGYLALWLRWSWCAWRSTGERPTMARLGSVVTLLTVVASAVDYPMRTPLHAALFTVATAWLAVGSSTAATEGRGLRDHPGGAVARR